MRGIAANVDVGTLLQELGHAIALFLDESLHIGLWQPLLAAEAHMQLEETGGAPGLKFLAVKVFCLIAAPKERSCSSNHSPLGPG